MRRWTRGVLVGVAAGIGLLVGLRAIAGLDGLHFVTFLEVQGFPLESLGIEWSKRAVWPAELQSHAATGLIATVATLFLAASAVGTLNAVILLAEGAAGRRSEFAVRSAVGATPRELARMLLRELRTLAVAGTAMGILAGITGGLAVRAAWPGGLEPFSSISGFDVTVAVSGMLILIALAHLATAWQVTRAGRAVLELKAGSRTGADPFAVFVRKALAATHVAIAGTCLVAIVTLAGGLSGAGDGSEGDRTIVIDARSPEPGGWSRALASIRSVPGIEAESLSAPGALVGLGVRDIAIAECGRCIRGTLPAPLWNALADHHVVSAGFFDLTDTDLLEGRVLSWSDTGDSEPVAIVNRMFAATAFENGAPLGKRVRIGADFDEWYTVVGVVEDRTFSVLGADGTSREAVYLSAEQHPPRSGQVLLRGEEEAIVAVEALLAGGGFEPGTAMTLNEYRSDAAVELRWAWQLAFVLGLLTVALAAHGIYATALQTSRRRTFEVAVRRSVGAPSYRIVTYLLGERLRVTGWGVAGIVFFGTLVAAFLENATGMRGASPPSYLMIAGALATVAMLASVRATREALAVEPASLLH